MQSPTSAPRFRRPIRSACGLAVVLGAGALAAAAVSSAAPADTCLVLPLSCPTISTPTIPTISVPLPTTPAPTTTAPATQPPGPGGTTPTPTQTSAAGGTTASEAFSYTVTRISARRSGPLRWIALHFSLSHGATVVAVLHRSDVPALVAVRTGRAGANRFAVAVPARVHAGRYALRLVFATGTGHHTVTRSIAIPR